MVVWMRHRGHSWSRGVEMTGAMIVPAVALIGLLWLHVVSEAPLCGIYCLVMIPAMLITMLWRRSEYTSAPALR